MTLKCTDCVHAFLVDNGYSNWTIEGTDLYCGYDLHPDAPFDKWYNEENKLEFAEDCPSFNPGTPVWIDVDECDADPEDLAAWREYNS